MAWGLFLQSRFIRAAFLVVSAPKFAKDAAAGMRWHSKPPEPVRHSAGRDPDQLRVGRRGVSRAAGSGVDVERRPRAWPVSTYDNPALRQVSLGAST